MITRIQTLATAASMLGGTTDIGPGLLSRILRQLGLEREDFDNA